MLMVLRDTDGFVSGEKLSEALGVTRAAIWKKVRELRSEGYIIEAAASRGYRLVRAPDLSSEEVISAVQGAFWKDALFYRSLGSTNDFAVEQALDGHLQPGTVIIADMQEKGRGRMGRTWTSPPGVNIYMSLVIKPCVGPRDATLITLLSSLACANAIRRAAGMDVSIKWPNDIMASGKKTGGILTEIKADQDSIALAIIGIGINVNSRVADFPEELRETATSMKIETGREHARSDIVIRILQEFEYLHGELARSGKTSLLSDWRKLCSTLGKRVLVTSGDAAVAGIAEDIDDEGLLLLRLESGGLKKISSGDVTLRS